MIKAYAELLDAQMPDPELSYESRTGMREVVKHIIDQAELMTALIEEILDVQRVQLGKLPLEVSRLDLAQLARAAADEVSQAAHTHTIRVESIEALPPVDVDRRRIRQVLVNLLENAVKYSDNGEIQVNVGREDTGGRRTALLSVHDHGIGLDAGHLDRIFDRFAQARSAPVRGHAGLGLGLYVARQIARAHGGEVWAESRGKGRGSTFYLRLPLKTGLERRLTKDAVTLRTRGSDEPFPRRQLARMNNSASQPFRASASRRRRSTSSRTTAAWSWLWPDPHAERKTTPRAGCPARGVHANGTQLDSTSQIVNRGVPSSRTRLALSCREPVCGS